MGIDAGASRRSRAARRVIALDDRILERRPLLGGQMPQEPFGQVQDAVLRRESDLRLEAQPFPSGGTMYQPVRIAGFGSCAGASVCFPSSR